MVFRSTAAVPRWDILCRVVDNYGDAAVCFRLARALAREHGLPVRLVIDRPRVLAALRPDLCMAGPRQWLDGVEVVDSAQAPDDGAPAVTIDAFGGGVDEARQQAMEGRQPRGLWIVLEYLTAEPFAERLHAMPSPPPLRTIPRWFFFPGFTPGTGGLLRERGLLARREAFLAAPGQPDAFLASVGVARPRPGAHRVSLFTYPGQPALAPLLAAMSRSPVPTELLVPPGPVAGEVAGWAGTALPAPGEPGLERGGLTVTALPFLPQDEYDRLLWSCDLNIVRGEDSFVRAQWAGRPLLWRPYPQPDGADRVKGEAFLDAYLAGAPVAAARALRQLQAPWLGPEPLPDAGWTDYLDASAVLRAHARAWADGLAAGPDLASRLVSFCLGKLQ